MWWLLYLLATQWPSFDIHTHSIFVLSHTLISLNPWQSKQWSPSVIHPHPVAPLQSCFSKLWIHGSQTFHITFGRKVSYFLSKKSGVFPCSGLFKEGVVCFEITEVFIFSPVIFLKSIRLSDRQIWQTQTLKIKNFTFFWTFSMY